MKWVTRERPKIERIACPWLIARFIDLDPEFIYVPAARVREVAERTGAIPFDIPGVELGHVGELCSFDAFLRKYSLGTRALRRLAVIVAARTPRASISCPNAQGCMRYPSASPAPPRTISSCSTKAWSCTKPCTPGPRPSRGCAAATADRRRRGMQATLAVAACGSAHLVLEHWPDNCIRLTRSVRRNTDTH